jgi:hypothetical protein
MNDYGVEIVGFPGLGVKGELGGVARQREFTAPPFLVKRVADYAAGVPLRPLAADRDVEDLRTERVVTRALDDPHLGSVQEQ